MTKFKKTKTKEKPVINTASLPDIIFMLLFFFMVVTVLKDATLQIQVITPQATELQKLKHRSLVQHIYVGKPMSVNESANTRIQINDSFVDVKDIQKSVKAFVVNVEEYKRPLITANLKIDQEVEMGIVTDIKTELRKADQLKINYAATPISQN